jgi:hypothetical protein
MLLINNVITINLLSKKQALPRVGDAQIPLPGNSIVRGGVAKLNYEYKNCYTRMVFDLS